MIYIIRQGTLTIKKNSTFINNIVASGSGGCISCDGSSIIIEENVNFLNNEASESNGGVFYLVKCSLKLSNNILI